MKNTEQLQSFFEEQGFNVHLHEQDGVQCAEVESWTNGGVDMVITLNPFTEDEFFGYVDDFDVDDEVDSYRGDKLYKANFTISQSIKDFKAYHKEIKGVAKKLKGGTK